MKTKVGLLTLAVLAGIWFTVHLLFSLDTSNRYIVMPGDEIHEGLITFRACNGFANQRLSIVYGVMIAMLMHKTLVLPRLPFDGTQKEDSVFVDGTDGYTARFSEIYNFDRFKTMLQGLNVPVWEVEDVPRAKFYNAKCDGLDLFTCVEQIDSELQNSDVPINFGCTFPSSLIGSDQVLQHERIMRVAFQNLVPA